EGQRLLALNGRFTYVAGKRAFVFDESSAGTNRLGAGVLRQVVTFGDAERPALTGNFNVSLFPTSKITLSNQVSYNSIRMVGNSYFVQFASGQPSPAVLPFQFLGIQTIANSTIADFHYRPWLGVHAG